MTSAQLPQPWLQPLPLSWPSTGAQQTSRQLGTFPAAIMVGGITDQHGQGDKLYSTLHGDIYLFNMDTSRWFPLAVRAPKKKGAAGAAPDQADHSASPGECVGWPST